jgi:hypothetical protein
MMARTFRMAFAESWDGPHLSLRGFKSYIGRLPINPYVSLNKTEKVCQKGSRGFLAQEDPVVWFDSVAKWRRSTNCSRTNSTAGRGAPGKLSAATQNPPPRTSFVGLLL